MLGARSGHLCVAIPDGRVLVAGGNTGDGATNAASSSTRTARSGAPPARCAPLASGPACPPVRRPRPHRRRRELRRSSLLEIFDPASDSFVAVAQTMAAPRARHAAAVLRDGRVLLAGGSDGHHALRSIDVFDPLTNTVTPLAELSVPRAGLSAIALLDGRIIFAGGDNDTGVLASTETTIRSSSVSSAAPMSASRTGHAALRIPRNNSVLLSGGDSASAELYIPWTDSYRRLASPRGGRSGAFVAPLPDGLVLAAGEKAEAQAVATVAVPVIATDKSDYQPGDQVTISGANWKPGEVVAFNVTRSPNARSLQLTTTADPNGQSDKPLAELMMTPDDVGTTYTLTASGNLGSTAQAIVFTDGNVGERLHPAVQLRHRADRIHPRRERLRQTPPSRFRAVAPATTAFNGTLPAC